MKTRNGLTRLGMALFGISTVALVSCGGDSSSSHAQRPMSCDQLVGLAIPADAMELSTSGGEVTAAEVVEASGSGAAAVPEHCLVSGRIAPVDPQAPDIQFKVALPTEWNSKVLMFGGGGFNGSIPAITGDISQGAPDQPTPLGRGYATFASDSGHQANEYGSQDGRWGLNDEAVRNFSGEALKKTRDAATFVIEKRYASEPTQSYFAGGSTGGREALTNIQRWPDDWDGAIAWYPAWNNVAALLAGQYLSRALAEPGAYPDSGERQKLLDAALEACDAMDGVEDGLISDQRQCNETFDPATAMVDGNNLRCPGGADDGDHCLSDAQIEALNAMNDGVDFNFPLASGETGYPGSNVWGADLGITTIDTPVQPTVVFLALGTAQPVQPDMPRNAPYLSVLVDQWVKYSVAGDADFNSFELDPVNPEPQYAERISELSGMLNSGTDISAFADRGGKLLLAHGLSDVLVSSRATEIYYQRLLEQMGQEKVDSFVRYYEIPGFGHGASSHFHATWDSLTALENWVEQDMAPEDQVTMDLIGAPGRTRPLCDYPAWPRYVEGGDPMSASSFECVE
ncbi:tannase/feruloyl esterase family alpha/beta hydrolase [Alloalcanivorax xenomutans]|uniref:Tannase/feruloyl esterase family alpha/beta hydrolase n=1 Tax=Alloalcanivorax xenomutans TaxID=1094342 RepID=A0A9Q3ZET8_9GAMM|nr:tannase/feruloyl esterase family alpha/beta hydrolase [Alloalcanivorax xenomutans]MCE7507239.1 tannase/feruloyl esterase family alpha/beta hydrolase [Alloalcanivorax xenomutans]